MPKSIDSGVSSATGTALLINLGLIALFGVQHNVMARSGFKAWWTKIMPKRVKRSTYVLLSSLILILLYWQWRPMGQVIWQADAAWSAAALWGVFGAGFGLVLLSTFIIDHFDLFGLRQVTLNLLQKEYTHPGFKVTLLYKIVRHPLYGGWFLAFWGTPTMTLGYLLLAVGMSAYILIAIQYEERDLVKLLGEDYANYRARVCADADPTSRQDSRDREIRKRTPKLDALTYGVFGRHPCSEHPDLKEPNSWRFGQSFPLISMT